MRGWIFLVFKDVLHVVFNYSIVSSRVDSVLTQNYHFELKIGQNLSLETNNLRIINIEKCLRQFDNFF